jgi:hypothetical protein
VHYLDWENKPSPFEVYTDLPSISLTHDFPLPKGESLAAISGITSRKGRDGVDLLV